MNTYQHNNIIIFVFFFTVTHIASIPASFFAHCSTIKFLEWYDLYGLMCLVYSLYDRIKILIMMYALL